MNRHHLDSDGVIGTMTERVTATTKPYTIGRPPFRPGDDADFGGKFTEQPGDLSRPNQQMWSARHCPPCNRSCPTQAANGILNWIAKR